MPETVGKIESKAAGRQYGDVKIKAVNHRIISRSQTVPSRIDKAYHLFDIGRELLRPEIKKTNLYRLIGIGVDNLGEPSETRLFDLEGGDDDKRNRLEAAVDQLHGKMGIGALHTGRQFARAYDRSAKQKPANDKPDH